jgi:hypothetical protein
MGATSTRENPGSIAHSSSVVPETPVFASWRRWSFSGNPPQPVYSLPNFVSALFQVQVQVPDPIPNLGGTTLSSGVQRVPLGLSYALSPDTFIPIASNAVAVYVK